MRRLSANWRTRFVVLAALLLLTAAPRAWVSWAQDDAPAEDTPAEAHRADVSTDDSVNEQVSDEPPAALPDESTPTEAPTDAPTAEATAVATTLESGEEALPSDEAPIATAIPLPDEPALALLVETSFDDGDLSAWRLGAGWTLVASGDGGALRLDGSTGALQLVQTGLEDVVIEARFLSSGGTAQLLARQSEGGAYSASLSPDGAVELARGGSPLASAQVGPSEDGQWRMLRLSVMDGMLRVSVDGAEVIGKIDDDPFPAGAVSVAGVFAPDTAGSLTVDDVRVWLAEGETPPEPPVVAEGETTAEAEAAPEMTPDLLDNRVIVVPEAVTLEATAEATSEATVETQEEEVTAQAGPAAPPLTSPADNATVTTGRPTFKWGTGGATRYRLEVSDDNFSTDRIDINTTSKSYTLTVSLPQGAYKWRVSACTGTLPATCGDPSDERTITVNIAKKPSDNGTVTTGRPIFEWYTMSGAANYRLQIDDEDDLSFATPIIDKNPLTGTSYTLASSEVLQQGTYYWRIGTLDPADNLTWTYSARRMFTVNLMKSPSAGAATTNTRPTFSWYAMSGAACYRLVIQDEALLKLPIIYTTTSGTTTSKTIPSADPPLDYDRYLWRMDVDATPPCDDTWTDSPFTRLLIVTPSFPAKPTLLSPPSGRLTNNNLTLLDWNDIAGAVDYEIQIDNSASFNNPITITDIVGDSFYDPAVEGALPDGKLYWRVRARNNLGALSSWSSVRNLTVDTIDPAIPGLRDPLDNATTTDSTPSLRWFSAAGASTYQVRLGTENGGPCALTDDNLVKTTSSLEFTPPGALLFTTYCWQVQAADKAGNVSGWSDPRTLTINSPTSAAPVLNRNDSAIVTLTWTPVSWALAYQIQIDDTSSFSSPIISDSTISGDAFSYTTPDLPDGIYRWRIRAKKPNGSWGGWSKTSTFSVDV